MLINIAIMSAQKDNRKAIISLLTEHADFRITSIGADAFDVLRSARTQQPDIIIMDFNMEDIESPNLAPIIKRNSPSTSLIVLYPHEERNIINKALNAGISGCLFRHEISDNLASSVRVVFHGGLYISNPMRKHVLNHNFTQTVGTEAAHHAAGRSFSPTELQIFYGIVCGFTDREIAKSLNISRGSLRNCVSHVKKKTGFHNRTQITAYALLRGIINIEKIRDNFSLMNR
jgi:two-component system response regulator NreC